MKYLNALDYSIIVIYFVFLIGLGWYLKKKASASIEDYFIGGRSLPWWALGISGMASWLDITGTLLIVSFLYMLGPRGLYIEFRGGAGLVLAVCLLWTGKWHRRSGCITGAEWMAYRFGNGFSGQFARFVSVISAIVGTIGMLAYMVKGVGLFLSMFLPFTPFQCALVMVTIATIYTVASGFYGVVFTDIFQSGIILIAVIAISAMAIAKLAGVEDFGAIATAVTGSENWTSSKLPWRTEFPEGYKCFNHLAMFSFFYLLRNVIGGMGGGAEPKYFAAKSDRECGLLSFLWGSLMMFRWPLMISFAVLGIFLVQTLFPDQQVLVDSAELIKVNVGAVEESMWPELLSKITNSPEQYPEISKGLQNLLGEKWQASLPLLGYNGIVNPERILPAVILHNIHVGFRGLILIALIAASMSTFDSTVNATTGFFTKDIYSRLRPDATTKELIYASWAFGVALVVLGFVLGYRIPSVNAIWGWVIMGFGGGLLAPSVLRLYWWRFNGGGFAIGTTVGLMAAILNKQIWTVLTFVFPLGELNDWKLFCMMFAIGLIASVIGTYLTKPTDKEILEHFYKTTRPFGIWGKLNKTLSPQLREATKKEHFNDIIALPFTLGWQISLLLLPMQLIIKSYTAFFVTLIIFIVSLAGMYIFWYRKLDGLDSLNLKDSQ